MLCFKCPPHSHEATVSVSTYTTMVEHSRTALFQTSSPSITPHPGAEQYQLASQSYSKESRLSPDISEAQSLSPNVPPCLLCQPSSFRSHLNTLPNNLRQHLSTHSLYSFNSLLSPFLPYKHYDLKVTPFCLSHSN